MLHRKFRKKLFGDDRAEERRNTNPYFCVSAAGNIVRTLAVIVEGFQELLRQILESFSHDRQPYSVIHTIKQLCSKLFFEIIDCSGYRRL